MKYTKLETFKLTQKWVAERLPKRPSDANTVIASPSGELAINPFANPLLSIAAVGCFIHSMAGEMLKEKIGHAGALASDLLPLIPRVLRKISKG